MQLFGYLYAFFSLMIGACFGVTLGLVARLVSHGLWLPAAIVIALTLVFFLVDWLGFKFDQLTFALTARVLGKANDPRVRTLATRPMRDVMPLKAFAAGTAIGLLATIALGPREALHILPQIP